MNGGTCTEGDNTGFICTCPDEFSGSTCENEKVAGTYYIGLYSHVLVILFNVICIHTVVFL